MKTSFQNIFPQLKNSPWITFNDLNTVNKDNKLTLNRLLRIPESMRAESEQEQIKILNALQSLQECSFNEANTPKHFYEVFSRCETIVSTARMELWSNYLDNINLFSNEAHALAIAYAMGIMHCNPVQFAGYLHHLLSQQNIQVEDIIQSGLCHVFAQHNEPSEIESCYKLLSDFPSADAKKTKQFIQRLDEINSNGLNESRAIYSHRALSGKENIQAKAIQIKYPTHFGYTNEKLHFYCNHFGLDFLVRVLLDKKDSVQLKKYVQHMDNEQLTALYAYPLAGESKAGFYSALQRHLTPAQKDSLFRCMDKWIFCASLSESELHNLSDGQLQALLQTPIQKNNAVAACTILFGYKKIKEASSVYQVLFDCFFESPGLLSEDFRLPNSPELVKWCKDKTQEMNQNLNQLLDKYTEFTQDAYDKLSDAFQSSHPQRNLLTRLSPIDLLFPKGNYEFYATLLYGFYKKNQLDLKKIVDSIHQFVPHDTETAEEICNAKKRTLYEALIYIRDEAFQKVVIDNLRPLDWEYSIADQTLSELALAQGNISFFELYAKENEEEVLACFEGLKDTIGEQFFEVLMDQPDLVRYYFSLYTEEARSAVFKEKSSAGNTLLHRTSQNPDSLNILLDLLPEAERLAAVEEKNAAGDTVLHKASWNPESLNIILRLYPENERLAEVKKRNAAGDTLLHRTSWSTESLNIILGLYPENERLAAVQEINSDGDTVLHSVSESPESLNIILRLFPEASRLAAVQRKNNSGNTVFHVAAENLESLRILLKLLPEASRLAVVIAENSIGNTLLHEVSRKSKSLKILLKLLPQAARPVAVKEKNTAGDTVLHTAAVNHKSLKLILELYPANERLAAVIEKNASGDTVLDKALHNPESLKTILKLLPEKEKHDLGENINRMMEAFQNTHINGVVKLLSEYIRGSSVTVSAGFFSGARNFNYVTQVKNLLNDIQTQKIKDINDVIMIFDNIIFPNIPDELAAIIQQIKHHYSTYPPLTMS